MPIPADPADAVDIVLVDGRRLQVHAVIADRVRGVDADGDLLVPFGEPDHPIRHDDGTETLIPLTFCCHASGKGAESSTGVVCRGCYREVDAKYGGSGTLAVPVTAQPAADLEPVKAAPVTQIVVPPIDVAVTFYSRALFNRYGQITGIDYYNGGPRLSLRLHDGTRLVLRREGEDWILGPDDGEDIIAVTTLFGPDEQLTESAREAVDELWHAACEVIDQLTRPVVAATADDLVQLLDRAMTRPSI